MFKFINKIIFIISSFVICVTISSFAFASDPLTAGLGWAGLAGSGVTIGGMAGLTANQFNNVFNSQTGIDLDTYLNDPAHIDEFISFGNNTIQVDDVQYSDLWISHDFASYLQSEGFGYIIDSSINSESSGVLANGFGFIYDVPMFSVDGIIRSQSYSFTIPSRDSAPLTFNTGTSFYIHTKYNTYNRGHISIIRSESVPSSWSTCNISDNSVFIKYEGGGYYWYSNSNFRCGGPYNLDVQEFDFSYVSELIDTQPIASDEGLRVYIPTSLLPEPSGQYFIDGAGNDDLNVLISILTQAVSQGKAHSPEYEPFIITPPVPPPAPTPTPIPTPSPIPTTPIDEATIDELIQPVIDAQYETADVINQQIFDTASSINGTLNTITLYLTQQLPDVIDNQESMLDNQSSVIDSLDSIISNQETQIDNQADLLDAVEDAQTAIGQVVSAVNSNTVSVTANQGLILSALTDLQDTLDNISDDTSLADIESALSTASTAIVSAINAQNSVISSESDDIQGTITSTAGTIGGILERVRQGIESGVLTLSQAIALVRQAVSSLQDVLEGVLEAVITHPLDLMVPFLDNFTLHGGIGGILDSFKENVGIWHYVVEWLGSIMGVFTFFFGLMNSTSYYIVLPFYAMIAGAICLAFYKRFGR